jgi:Fur family ferric uptake transcriptional regulator
VNSPGEDLDQWQQRCKAAGLQMTAPRRAVLAALAAQQHAVDAVALLVQAREHYPRASIGTVYRFMRELEQHALVQVQSEAHGRIHWRLVGTAQPVAPAPDMDALAILRQIAERLGYRLIRRNGDFIY